MACRARRFQLWSQRFGPASCGRLQLTGSEPWKSVKLQGHGDFFVKVAGQKLFAAEYLQAFRFGAQTLTEASLSWKRGALGPPSLLCFCPRRAKARAGQSNAFNSPERKRTRGQRKLKTSEYSYWNLGALTPSDSRGQGPGASTKSIDSSGLLAQAFPRV